MKTKIFVIIMIAILLTGCQAFEPSWKVYEANCFGTWEKTIAIRKDPITGSFNTYIYPTGESVVLPVGSMFSTDPCVFILTDIQFDGNFQPGLLSDPPNFVK